MTAVARDLYVEQGATFTLGFTWHRGVAQPDGTVAPGETYDLAGWSARMQIRRSVTSAALLTATTSNNRITLNREPGRVELEFSDEDTMLLTIRTGVYDLEVEDPDGRVYRLLEGAVTISPNVTREDG